MRNKHTALGAVLVALTLALSFSWASRAPVQVAGAAPLAAITPVAIDAPISGDYTIVTFYKDEVFIADGQKCIDLSEYRTMDLEWVVDKEDTNATTLTLEHTNGSGADLTVNTTGQTIVSAQDADGDGLNRYDLFGRYTCLDVNVTNSSPITWTVIGLAVK